MTGSFYLAGHEITIEDGLIPDDAPLAWLAAYHGFEWLRDLRALRNDASRRQARHIIRLWISHEATHAKIALAPEVIAQRIAAWIGQHDFFCASADDEFQASVLKSLTHQARQLLQGATSVADGWPLIATIKGLVYSALALPDNGKAQAAAMSMITKSLNQQILPDGGHTTRCPSIHMVVLRDLIDIRAILRQAHLPVPEALATTIDHMSFALRLLRHGDGSLALFNGGTEELAVTVDAVLGQSVAPASPQKLTSVMNIARIARGRTLLFLDCGSPPEASIRRNVICPLSLEISVGRDRLIVNAGAGPDLDASDTTDDDWGCSALKPDGGSLADPPLSEGQSMIAACDRIEEQGAVLIRATHNGWVPTTGLTHHREIYVSETGGDIRAEDRLEGPGDIGFTIRFHLHPDSSVAVLPDNTGAIIRLSSGQKWRLRAAGAMLSLRESYYHGVAYDPRAAHQLVLSSITDHGETLVKWALQRLPDEARQ